MGAPPLVTQPLVTALSAQFAAVHPSAPPQSLYARFKSYPTRTSIGPFDARFNAMTGRNGSGKSNLLDAICFVLGISNLSQVRVHSLQELIYKQGQAGVTTASVTIIFDNEDPSRSPPGYQDIKKITVTRQIAVGGRNKYLLNGKGATLSQVQSMFQSVMLNINNPHFLIMQGHISKVVNMKAMEVLGMVEEAAGTRLFEVKKKAAVRTIEKKERKLVEISRVLEEEIGPKLAKLRDERDQANRFIGLEETLRDLELKRAGTLYRRNKEEVDRMSEKVRELDSDTRRAQEGSREAGDRISELEQELEQLMAVRQKSFSAERMRLQESERSAAQAQAAARAKTGACSALVEEQESHLQAHKQALEEVNAGVSQKKKNFERTKAAHEKLEKEMSEMRARIRQLRDMLDLMSAGVAATESGKSVTNELGECKREKMAVDGAIKTAEVRMDFLQGRIKDKAEELERLGLDESANLKRQLDSAEAVLRDLEEKVRALAGAEDRAEKARCECTAAEGRWKTLSRNVDQLEAQLTSTHPPATDIHGIRGTIARLITVPEKKYHRAVEVAAGGRLYNVVVDTVDTGKRLLSGKHLRRRVTLIPLDNIHAERVQTGPLHSARLALEIVIPIEGAKDIQKALEYVFGRTFVCDDESSARSVTFGDLRCTSVTLEGDLYSPQGTLTGGATSNLGSVLGQVATLNAVRTELDALGVGVLQARRDAAFQERQEFREANNELALQRTVVKQLSERVSRCSRSVLEREIQKAREEIEELEEEKRRSTDRSQVLDRRIQEEMRGKDAKAKERRMKQAEREIIALQEAEKKAEPGRESAHTEFETVRIELEEMRRDVARMQEEETALCCACDRAREERTAARKSETELIGEHQKASDELVEFSKIMESEDEKLRHTRMALEERRDERARHDSTMINCTHRRKNLEREQKEMTEVNKRLRDQYKDGLDVYRLDDGVSLAEATQELEAMRHEVNNLSKSLNRRACGMLEAVEKEYDDLMAKHAQVLSDKKHIMEAVKALDDTKQQALEETHRIVNEHLGKMFETLLPGTTAALERVDADDITQGLVVRVAFGRKGSWVWKEGLTELSGGQRSLLALALILSLLVFKPAPLYVLDEIDEALDLSHTHNIGKVLREEEAFKNSQFIVVSLKEGMFSQANVVFRARAVQGRSQVVRTQNPP